MAYLETNAVRRLVRFGGLLVLAGLVHSWMSAAGTLEARYSDVVLRLGQTKPSAGPPGVTVHQRAQALAFESRWQTAVLLLLRALELRQRQEQLTGGATAAPSSILQAPTFLVPMQGNQVVRTPRALLEAYRMPRLVGAGVPRGCDALAACVESVTTFGNQALGLASQARVPEVSLRAALVGLDRVLQRTHDVAEHLRLRLGPMTDTTDWAAHVHDESLVDRWRTADSLERALLTEGGASPSEVASYVDWIAREPLALACMDCTKPAFWQAAREALHARLTSGDGSTVAIESGTRLSPGTPRDPPGVSSEEPDVVWFDAMGRRVWSEPSHPRGGPTWSNPDRSLPRGIYFVRDARRGSLRIRRVVVFD